MNYLFSSVAVACFAITASCTSSPKAIYSSRPEDIKTSEVYVHRGSNVVFPVEIAGFQRVNVTRYDRDGLDVGAGYRDKNLTKPIEMTVYVYPGLPVTSIGSPDDVIREAKAHLCGTSFRQSKQEILKSHKDAILTDEKTKPYVFGGKNIVLNQAKFDFTDQKLSSVLIMYCPYNDDWILKFRATFPNSFDGSKELDKMKQAFLQNLDLK